MSIAAEESVYGRIVTGWDVEQWTLSVLKRWSCDYVQETARQHGEPDPTALSRVRGWALGTSFDKWPEDQVPGVLVICSGIVPPPVMGGDGYYRARWSVRVGCICSANSQMRSHQLAQLYIAAHKAAVAQHGSLEGHADGVAWIDESYDALDYDDTRSLYAGYATLLIDVADVLSANDGPIGEPRCPDEWEPWPLVETVDIEVDNYEVDQPLPKEEA